MLQIFINWRNNSFYINKYIILKNSYKFSCEQSKKKEWKKETSWMKTRYLSHFFSFLLCQLTIKIYVDTTIHNEQKINKEDFIVDLWHKNIRDFIKKSSKFLIFHKNQITFCLVLSKDNLCSNYESINIALKNVLITFLDPRFHCAKYVTILMNFRSWISSKKISFH